MQWAKSKASARSWSDDVRLLVEEMRRVEAATRHIAGRWTWKSKLRSTAPSELQDGLAGYALRHAAMEECLADKWAEQWRKGKARAAPILVGDMEAAEEAERQTKTDVLIEIELEEDDSPPIDDDF